MRSLLRAIARLNRWHAVVFVGVALACGQLLNIFWPFDSILLYQILFVPAILIAFSEIQRFLQGIEKFRTIIASHPNREDGECISSLLHSYWYFVALALVGGLFVFASIELKYVTFDPTGIYALAMIVLVMVSAVLGQLCYLYYIILLRRIANGRKFKYNFYLPARTNWVRLIHEIGIRLTNAFFVLGFIYTLVYFLNVKDGYLTLSRDPFQFSLATPNDLVFLVSWTVLFGIVVIAFPCYVWLHSTYMNAVVRLLKDLSIEEVSFLISGEKETSDRDDRVKYYRMMMDIDASVGTPKERFNFVPVVATMSSIAVHVIKISESF